jgi:Flp pilus assembly protein TadD
VDTHLYLKKELFTRLSPAEQAAIEAGFRQAVASSDRGAAINLAAYYAMSGHFLDQAKLYEEMAWRKATPAEQLESLLNAGLAYLKSSDLENAERVFRKAIAASPGDARAYQKLATEVYGARNFIHAEKIIAEGAKAGAPTLALYLSLAAAASKTDKPAEIKQALALAQKEIQNQIDQGSDPYPLYLELADGARQAGDHAYEIAALRNGLETRPRSRETLSRLAAVYAEQNNFDRAALYLTRITNLDSPTADAFFQLAVAEEARYRFAAADRAYARAMELAPNNLQFRKRYAEFKTRMAIDREAAGSGVLGAGRSYSRAARREQRIETDIDSVSGGISK